uniref:Uncharacterized protein n=1 Tax=Phakopsora pachyrhizi TaxID=170000 RepID=A0A0S1MJ17_PHAPC
MALGVELSTLFSNPTLPSDRLDQLDNLSWMHSFDLYIGISSLSRTTP